MPRRGENIYKRKDNRWEGRYLKTNASDGKTHYGYVYAKSYKDVKVKLAKAKQTTHPSTEHNGQLLSTYCDKWLVLSRNRVKESTYVKYNNIIQRHINPHLGAYHPQKLNAILVESFSNELLRSGLASKTVRDILSVLRSVLEYCRKEIGAELPDIEIIYPKDTRKEMRVLTTEEQHTFTDYLLTQMDPVKFGVLLALLTGMRIGEICSLCWRDISLIDGTVTIRTTMQRLQTLDPDAEKKTKVVVTDTKSENSRRIIPLTEYAMKLCQKMKVANKEAYVLTGKTDRFMEPRALQYRLRSYTRMCNLPDVHFHVLRHTFATRCVEVGFEIKSLSEILGHASPKITLDRYVHSSLALKRTNMEKLSAVGL